MAAIEENQRPLCKAGAIGVLSAIETEVENSMAACKKCHMTSFQCALFKCIQIMHTMLSKTFREIFLATFAGV
jgi:hypothetical protein